MLESKFQSLFLSDVRKLFPGCIVLKNDSSYQQGIPDWTIFYGDRWATLEIKRSGDERPRPNQSYYVNLMNELSFSTFVYPENAEEVLDALQQALKPRRSSRRVQR